MINLIIFKIFKALPIILMILAISLFVITVKEHRTDSTLEDVKLAFNDIIGNTSTYFVEEVLPYKNPHSNNFTSQDLINNIIHITVYPFFRLLDTVVGYTVQFSWKYAKLENIKYGIRICLFFVFIVLFSILIKPIAIIYLLIQEYLDKKNIKRKWWITLLISIGSILLVALLFWLLTLII